MEYLQKNDSRHIAKVNVKISEESHKMMLNFFFSSARILNQFSTRDNRNICYPYIKTPFSSLKYSLVSEMACVLSAYEQLQEQYMVHTNRL